MATPEYEWQRLLERARNAEQYTEVLQLCRLRRTLTETAPNPYARRTLKVSLLGGATTETMEPALGLALSAVGLEAKIRRSDYNTFVHEMIDPDSETARFKPEVAVLVNTAANIRDWPQWGETLDSVRQLAGATADYWLNLCTALHSHTSAEILINTFHPSPLSPLGNIGAKLPWDPNSYIRRVNRELCDRLPAYVHVNDVESISAKLGLNAWFDPRYWYQARQPISFQSLWAYVRNTARIIGGLYGCSAKCIVVDLDNTLWGGVVGDDGVEGILIGEGDALGEAFKAFQEYLLQLKQRGVMLAVCSKNDESNVYAALETRKEMVLRKDDFACIRANWRPKPENIADIAATLNIGLDSLVFIDDNPAERDIVKSALPQVRVIELSDDPVDYPYLLEAAGLFETTSLSSEDEARTRQYIDNSKRSDLQKSALDYGAFLASLGQKAVIGDFDTLHLDRITQLINKTNQFNLTTERKSRSEVEALMRNEQGFTAYVRLADRFGDNGLISVAYGHLEGTDLHIDGWLMSCRVLKREVEHLLCNHIVQKARAMRARRLCGVYKPTEKNGLVSDHYRSLGFASIPSNGAETRWELNVDDFSSFTPAIELVKDY